MDQIKFSKYSPDDKDPPKPQGSKNFVTAINKTPPLECGHSTISGGMWTLKYDIRSPKLYELLLKIELKGDTALDLNNFY